MHVTTATRLRREMVCIGSARMEPSFPSIDADRTGRNEGDAAHWLAKEVFDGRGTLEEYGDRKAANGTYITSEMSDHVAGYLSALNCGTMEVNCDFGNDRWRVNARADHIIYTPQDLTVDDFKYGWHIVEPDENWTLLAYAIGYCITRQVQPAVIHLRIHQPRPLHRDGKLRTWSISYAQLMEYYAQLDARLSNPTDELRASIEHCGRCYANATCPAAAQAMYNAMDAAGIAYRDNIGDDELAYILDEAETAQATLDARVEAFRDLAAHRIRDLGGVIRNRAWEQRFGHRKWRDGLDPATVQILTGVDVSKSGMITPAAAERAGIAKAIMATMTETPSIGGKLVRVDSARRAAKLLGGKS